MLGKKPYPTKKSSAKTVLMAASISVLYLSGGLRQPMTVPSRSMATAAQTSQTSCMVYQHPEVAVGMWVTKYLPPATSM